MTTPEERHILLQGSYNFRDVGGYRAAAGSVVRWQRLYRSDALHRLTLTDLDRLQAIGVSTLLDLRTADELAASGQSPLIERQGVRHHHVPFVQDLDDHREKGKPVEMDRLYRDLLEQSADALRGVFLDLAEDSTYPAVVHCTAGKDRTGMTVALVLRILGVADPDIARDYALTYGYLEDYNSRRRAAGEQILFADAAPELLASNPELILGLLTTVDQRYGSSEQFLRDCGLPTDAFGQIRELLLDRPAPE